ncbi:MAG: Gfo/Idh/MocA family oxidoreductase [Spirochaetaceae bacterium]|nr:Gfo/Idh/MocA family oxidoreductase [Spirochaetaceae bacterium]
MAGPVRIVIVGVGRGRSHLRSVRALGERFEVAGVVDQDAARLARVCAEEQVAPDLAFPSLEEALTAGTCDAVMVATWARTHEALVGQALDADAHVLVEKPFTLTVASARRLLAVADERGRKVVVTQQWRYLPGQRTMRRLLAERRWGQPQAGHMVSYKARGGEYPDSEHSQLWQMTVHEVDSLIAMMGEPVAAVSGHSFRPPATTWRRESTATAELTLAGGCRVVLLSTSDARINTLELRVECEHGALRYENSLSFGGVERITVATSADGGWQPVALDAPHPLSLDAQVAAGFADWINGGPEPETSGRRNLQVLGALDALLESGQTGRQVPVHVSGRGPEDSGGGPGC